MRKKERKKERKNRFLTTTVVIASCLMFLLPYSCQDKQEYILQNEPLAENNDFTVSENVATFVANSFAKKFKANDGNSLKSKKLKSLTKFKDENGEELIYIINYEEGGFLLLSADQRVAPILAFSETNSFTTEETDLPGAVNFWVQATKEEIKRVRKENKEQSKEVKFLWKRYLSASNLKYIPPGDEGGEDPPPCDDVFVWINPLLQTEWHQGCGFNSYLGVCIDPDRCNKMPVGCVAVAMAQIMKYHEHPSSYSWSNMPHDIGNTVTAQLMYDLGHPDALHMDYTCTSSTVPTSTIVPTFENVFNYSTSATHANYNQVTVKNEIDYNRPVILAGTDNTKNPPEAHAWVCDAYASAYYCETGISTLHFHMNWGLEDGDANGYYAYNNFNPGDYAFNSSRIMVTGIKP